jgi:REP element-mobilizing transposase RayT
MARQPRFEYPGAIYHVMARGNGGDDVFVTDDDRKAFLFRLGQVCASHGWKVHAWVIMGMLFWTIVASTGRLVRRALKAHGERVFENPLNIRSQMTRLARP